MNTSHTPRPARHPDTRALRAPALAALLALAGCGGGNEGPQAGAGVGGSLALAEAQAIAQDAPKLIQAAAADQVTVVAKGSLAGGVGPIMEVRVDGQLIGRVEVRAAGYQALSFPSPKALGPGTRIDLAYVNDTAWPGADRNLHVQSLTAGGMKILSTSHGVVYDKGKLDGVDAVPGQEDLLANGTLRFRLDASTAHALSFTWDESTAWQERFDQPTALNTWRFNPGSEFGGGSKEEPLRLVPDERLGQALEMGYSIQCAKSTDCPMYAAAVRTLDTPIAAQVLRLRIRNNLERAARVYFRVKDESGQTLQYRPERCPFETAGEAWCGLQADLRQPSGHFGGANNGRLNGKVTEIEVLVQSVERFQGRFNLQGVLAFDDVWLGSAPGKVALHRDTRGNQAAAVRNLDKNISPDQWGVAVHFTADRERNKQRLVQAREAGFGLVRTDVFWDHVERSPGVRDFTLVEQLLADAKAQGLKMLFILDYDNTNYRDGLLMSTTRERQAFAAYAAAAAQRFKGQGVKFEIWNEPNTGASCAGVPEQGFWKPVPDPARYAQLVTATLQAMRAVDPAVQVSSGGLVPNFTSPCDKTLPSQFSFHYIGNMHQAGGLAGLDALGYHPYFTVAEEWGAEVRMLRTLLAELGQGGMAVWDTEWGISSACPDGEQPCAADGHDAAKRKRQAVRLARRFLVSASLALPVNVWYDLVDAGPLAHDRDQNFGLLDTQSAPKPAWHAMKSFASAAKGRLTGVVTGLPPGLHAVRFQNGADTVYAFWAERGQITLNAATAGLVRAQDVSGAPLPTTGEWVVREADGPVYLTFR